MPKKIDLTGQTFGKLTILREATKEEKEFRPGAYWICQCQCGKQIIKNGQGIRKGETTSCGCDLSQKLKARSVKFTDETGHRYGKLVVLERDYEKEAVHPNRGSTYWKCQCDCGSIVSVLRSSLINGTTSSCGCFRKEKMTNTMRELSSNNFINEIGNKYGKLTVVAKNTIKQTNRQGVEWICQCDCGNYKTVLGTDLRQGYVSSCGCLGSSKGEFIIEQLLSDNNISFAKEYVQKINNNNLRFDFAVFQNGTLSYLIEYDGKQHFYPIDHFGGIDYFNYIHQHDINKNQWCKENNIPLIRIPYTHLNNLCLEDLLLKTSQFLIY